MGFPANDKAHMLTKNAMRLADFILDNMEPILQAWEDFARTIEPPALTMDDIELRDHARLMLTAIAVDLKTPQSSLEQSEKSQGRGPRSAGDTAAETHAEARLLSGYSVEQLVSEYRALRSSVLHLWTSRTKPGQATDMDDVTRFNEAIDQSLAESVARYALLIKQSENMFLAILGHDLRNPLGTVLTGATFIMRATEIPSKYVLAATRIFNSGQRMNKLIGDLIDFTRTHLGSGIPIKPKRMNLAEVCLNVVDELRTSHPERIIDYQAPAREDVHGDNDRLAQLLSNLIGNALQHGARNHPVSVRLSGTEQDVSVAVHNLGPVIPADKIGSVFDPLIRFAARDAMNETRDTSLGIGMFIAREVAGAHGGAITVASSADEGTTFCVTLPRRLPPRSRAGDR
jgi:signal transduction histidine kinase